MKIADAIGRAAKQLADSGIDTPQLDADLLLRHVLHKDRAWILTHALESVNAEALERFDQLIARRSLREPAQYIIGTQEFWGLPFQVTPAVLIPRPETEFVVESALGSVAGLTAPVIIDLCAGSGCIAIALAKELPNARIFALDSSEPALEIARKNAELNSCSSRIRFMEGDLFEPLEELDLRGRVDMIATNPPYVPSGVLAALQPEVRDFEPEAALVAGTSGTEIAERIIRQAHTFLRPGGSLIMEFGIGQTADLKKIVNSTGNYEEPEIVKDLAGIDRVIAVKRK